jgi:hypothetical protein
MNQEGVLNNDPSSMQARDQIGMQHVFYFIGSLSISFE